MKQQVVPAIYLALFFLQYAQNYASRLDSSLVRIWRSAVEDFINCLDLDRNEMICIPFFVCMCISSLHTSFVIWLLTKEVFYQKVVETLKFYDVGDKITHNG